MALADFQTYAPGAFAPGTNVDGIRFTSGLPMEVRPGAGPASGANGLGEVGGSPIDGITAEWDVPATAVVVRLSIHDEAVIELYDDPGALLATRTVPAIPQWVWRDELFLVPAPGAVSAKLTGGGINALLALIFTSP